ncbi:MAG TPA: tRNA (adenosine(37)-N6)-threonylcarbamoyltransferase complex ATPase subunit type 1 TsaE [Verrucomicrobia bacterium]|nr:tRNA (adenosine(37)-N6)-threonylcarbamoyltransferase complex ATPase subunit type 1 TsaE [Verrucomicrobiota bacterium]
MTVVTKTKQIRTSKSPEDTFRIAEELAGQLKPGCVIALHGDLGAGKTCFVQGLARALGVRGPVGSPTFTLINEHYGRLPLYHIDLYRIQGSDEALGLGLDEYLHGQGVTAIEWAERAADLLPAATLHVRITAGNEPEERTFEFLWGALS